jgi:hypothetical protein
MVKSGSPNIQLCMVFTSLQMLFMLYY